MSKTRDIVSKLKEESTTCTNPERLREIAHLLRFWSEWELADRVEQQARNAERSMADGVSTAAPYTARRRSR